MVAADVQAASGGGGVAARRRRGVLRNRRARVGIERGDDAHAGDGDDERRGSGFGVVGRREVGSGIRVVRGGDLFGIAADERVRARDAELRSGRARKYPVHERHRYRVCVLICRHIRRLGVDHVPSHGQGRVRPALRSLGDVLFRRLLLLDAHQALRRHLRHRRHHRPQSPDGDLILHPIPQRQAFRWIFRLRFVLLPPQRLGREFAPHPSVFPSRARGKTRRVLALIPNSGRSQAHIVALVIQIVRT